VCVCVCVCVCVISHLHIWILKKLVVLFVPVVLVQDSESVLIGHVHHRRSDLQRSSDEQSTVGGTRRVSASGTDKHMRFGSLFRGATCARSEEFHLGAHGDHLTHKRPGCIHSANAMRGPHACTALLVCFNRQEEQREGYEARHTIAVVSHSSEHMPRLANVSVFTKLTLQGKTVRKRQKPELERCKWTAVWDRSTHE
jgi:hypothetical protein